MSFSETIFLFFLALIIFGPKKLPEIARQVGKALNEFKRASNEFKAQIEQEISHLEVENKQTILPPSQPPDGATSRPLYGNGGHGKEEYADAELHHVEAPALTAAAPDGASTADESSSGEVASSHAVSGDAASDRASSEHASSNEALSDQIPVTAEQSPPAASDLSEAVTASDPVGAAVAPAPHSSDSHSSGSHA